MWFLFESMGYVPLVVAVASLAVVASFFLRLTNHTYLFWSVCVCACLWLHVHVYDFQSLHEDKL